MTFAPASFEAGPSPGATAGPARDGARARTLVTALPAIVPWAVTTFVVAAAFRLVFLAIAGAHVGPDGGRYVQLGQHLLAHGVFSFDAAAPAKPTIILPPLYPAFLAALDLAGVRSADAVAVVQALLDASTAVCILLIARTAVPLRPALAAAALYAIHPGPIVYATEVLTETLFSAILTAGVLGIVLGVGRDDLRRSSIGGALVGLSALCRPIALPLFVVLPCAILVRRDVARARRHAAAVCALAVLTVAPWCIRSSIIAGRFVPVQARGVINLYGTSRNNANPAVFVPFDQDPFYTQYSSLSTSAEIADMDRVGLGLAIRNIAANPGLFLTRRAGAYPHLFISSFDRFTGIDRSFAALLADRDAARLAVKLSLLVLFSIVPLVLALWSVVRRRAPAAAALSGAVWLYTLVVHLPLWIEYRFWLPAVPCLLVSAALIARPGHD